MRHIGGNMEEKQIVYKIILDCWDMAKRYCFITLDDFKWEMWCKEIREKENEYKKHSNALWHLYSEIITAIQHYKERVDKEVK